MRTALVGHLIQRVLRTIRDHRLILPGDRVGVALSGGADSVALLWLLREIEGLRDRCGAIAGLIHVNHGLRADEAERDEAFCQSLAARLALPIEIGRFDVAAVARATRCSTEAAARDVRYRFLTEAAGRLGATSVATGHTVDDQAETVLLRLFRGAGGRGVTGIRARRGLFIRPVLDCRRADLRRYLVDRGEFFCEDSSNADLVVPRNRMRRQLLPVIEETSPGAVAALARFASLSASDDAFLEEAAIKAAGTVVLSSTDGVQLDVGGLTALPVSLSRRVVRSAIESVAPRMGVSVVHVDAVLDLAVSSKSRGHLDLPGLMVERRGPTLCVGATRSGTWNVERRTRFEVPLPLPGIADVPEAGVSIASFVQAGVGPDELADAGHRTAVVQAASVTPPFVVRGRRPGDRLRPLGAPGHRKLQDVLVDRKVAREARDRVPIVVDSAGQIVWVVGLTIADECRVTAPTRGVVVLKVRRGSMSE